MAKTVIDCNYLLPAAACAYLLHYNGEAAFIENNTNSAVPALLEALEQEALKPDDVKYIIITHVHLDHAGGTSLLSNKCPRAKILAHPRAARHLIEPQKLVASARAVYGEQAFQALYGEIEPVAESRVHAVEDNEIHILGENKLEFFHTRGHAKHHMCVYDHNEGSIYSGDSFGLAYPMLQDQGRFIFPSSSPTDFEAEEALATLERIMSFRPKIINLTHFGEIRDVETSATILKEDIIALKKYRTSWLDKSCRGLLRT